MKLSDSIFKLPGIGPQYRKRLEKLNIFSISDLLYHIPHRYSDFQKNLSARSAQIGDLVTIKGQVTSIKNVYTRSGKFIQFAQIEDNSGTIDSIWFNQPFLTRTIKKGKDFSFSGKVDWFDRKKTLISPDYEEILEGKDLIHTNRLVPVYPGTRGVSSKWLRAKTYVAIRLVENDLEEFLPSQILKKYGLTEFLKAVKKVHFPDTFEEAQTAKQRLAFNELLFAHLKNIFRKESWQKNTSSHLLKIKNDNLEEYFKSLPFKLTQSQERSISEITSDLGKDKPMNRLLEGDVGSGKTVVAAAGAFISFVNGYQSIFMAPTQILAEQHFNTLNKIFGNFKVRISLVTSSGTKKDLGKTDIFVGTHALIHKKVEFENVSYICIDEQHRFGVEQRAHLIRKSKDGSIAPHVLTMTATPIPRTVALTLYGDLDLSTLDELPSGRKKITTWLVPPGKREGAHKWIREKITKEGVQAFIVCPLIEESEVESMTQIKAATQEYGSLKGIFPELSLGLLHGKLKQKDKSTVLDKFKDKKIDILVSTPVVEVGIDIPNATIMLVEAAERFGLAQLHQLRGRVGRSDVKSYCLLFTQNRAINVNKRLEALTKPYSGFQLAELDLKMRGPGEIFGLRQHGFSELKIASWEDAELIQSTKILAQEIVKERKKYKKLFEVMNVEKIVLN